MRTRTSLLVSVLAGATIQFTAAPPAQAAPVSCAGTVRVFDTRADGSLWYYEHRAPATGDWSWTDGRRIGAGFNGTTIASADGNIYYINSTGELRRYRYDGTKWTDGAGTLLSTGFRAYAGGTVEASADARGRLFTMTRADGGDLFSYDFAVSTTGRHADIAWGEYGMVVAAGDNVVYARNGYGRLFRFRYDPVSQRWTDHRREVGAGWDMFDKVFSPGGDVLYGIAGDTMYWYRFDADTGTWANGGNGRLVGRGWAGHFAVSATTNTCSVPAPPPIPPVTPLPATPNGPLATVGSQNPYATYTFVYLDASGHAVAARDTSTGLTLTALGGPALVSDLTTSSMGMEVAGLDEWGTAWHASAAPFNTPVWTPMASAGGVVKSLRLSDYGMVGIDRSGRLLYRDFYLRPVGGWWDMSGPVGFTGELSVGSNAASTYGVARRSDGSVHSFHVLRWGLNVSKTEAYRSGPVPGAAEFDLPAAATVNDREMLVARHTTTARPYALFGVEGAWDATWTPLPALDLAATPMTAAQVRNHSRAVAALGADGYVYVTGETGDQTREFRPWQRLGTTKAITPPTLTSPLRGDVEVAFRGTDGKLHHYTAEVQANWNAPFVFTGGPRG